MPPKRPGGTDYGKWDKFDAKEYGIDDESEQAERAEEMRNRDPVFQREQERKYKATLEDMKRTKARINELHALEKQAREDLERARKRQQNISTFGIVAMVVVVFGMMVLPRLLLDGGFM